MKANPLHPRRRFPVWVEPTVQLATGGAYTRDHTCAHIRGNTEFFAAILAGGPLDAPGWIPAGSWNSTYSRCGPWDMNDGAGQPCPSQTYIQRELIDWSTE